MTFQQTLETFKTELKAKLKVYFQNELKNSQQANSNSYELLQAVEKMTLHNGKRLRAFLAFLAYNLYADKDPERFEEVFTLGCSLEVFQTFCLIHDDIMDEATTRRGLPTIESLYLQNLPEGLSRERRISLARSTAILAGDMAFALSNSVFNKVSKKYYQKISPLFWQMQLEVCYGQIDDTLGLGIADINQITSKSILNTLDYKSGRYSVEKPLLLGATLAGAKKGELKKLSEAGKKLGVAFQLADDLLGMFGDESMTGKSVLADLREGKKTLLFVETYQKLNKVEKAELDEKIETKTISFADLEWFKEKVKENGIDKKMEQIIDKLKNESKKSLSSLKVNSSENLKTLLELSDFLISRNS